MQEMQTHLFWLKVDLGCLSSARDDLQRERQVSVTAEGLVFFLRFYLFMFRERGREGEREGNVWLALLRPPLGNWSTTQACALTGNSTGNPLVHLPQGRFNRWMHWSKLAMCVL